MIGKFLVAGLAATALLLAVPPGFAQEQHRGHVQEVLVKIETADGPKWFKLGKTLEPVEFREGDVVEFNYADDGTIESITVEEDDEAAETTTKQN